VALPDLITIYAVLFSAAWCLAYSYTLWIVTRSPILPQADALSDIELPTLSVVIAARNEEQGIGTAVESLLAQEYPALEIVMIDDRSTDATGEILDRLAADPRLKVVHNIELPDGWLGKVHALEQGMALASGEWILFSDADVHFEIDTFKRAVGHALSSNYDHLALLPRMDTHGFWHEVVMAAIRLLFVLSAKLHEIERPEKTAAVGIGAFNLFRRELYDRTEGMAWLKMEVVDDVGLGFMLKQAGGRNGYAYAGDAVHLIWYHTLGAMFRGLEKNLFGVGAHYSYLRMVWQVLLLAAFAIAPIVALQQPEPWIKLLGVGGYSIMLLNSVVAKQRFGSAILPGLFVPVGKLIAVAMMLHAAWHCGRRGGVQWRDTFYSLDTLRRGQRIKL